MGRDFCAGTNIRRSQGSQLSFLTETPRCQLSFYVRTKRKVGSRKYSQCLHFIEPLDIAVGHNMTTVQQRAFRLPVLGRKCRSLVTQLKLTSCPVFLLSGCQLNLTTALLIYYFVFQNHRCDSLNSQRL